MAIVYADGKQGIVKLVRFKIEVPLPISGPDTETALDPVFEKIFIKPETDDLQPIVPEYWRYFLAGTDLKIKSGGLASCHGRKQDPDFSKSRRSDRQAYSARRRA
jgi:hypothetical protein